MSNEWLTNLFSLRKIDRTSACDYITQSPFHIGNSWDLPERTVEEFSSDNRSPESLFYSYYCYDEDAFGRNTCDRKRAVDAGPVDKHQEDNDRLVQRFSDIVNDVLHYFGLQNKRYALGTDSTEDEYDDLYCSYRYDEPPQFSTRPDIVLLGEDDRHLPRKLESYNRGMSVGQEDRRDLYRGCVAICKVEKIQRRGHYDKKLEKLANCARYDALPFVGGF